MTDEITIENTIDVLEELINQARDIEGQLITCASRRLLAKKVGKSPSTIWRGIQVLKKSGTIKSYYDQGKTNYYKIMENIDG